MIRTFDEAIEAVRAEVAPLIGRDAELVVSGIGFEDACGYLVNWGVETPPMRSIDAPLPGAATFVDRRTGAVQITARAAEMDRIDAMRLVMSVTAA